jgi:hypothetical protein
MPSPSGRRARDRQVHRRAGRRDIPIFTETTTFQIMQSLRLDKGPPGPVHP